jgi:hypothetical protein
MSFDWKDYLELAKELGADAELPGELLSEAKFRGSISRAYYSLYNAALNRANGLNFFPQGPGQHDQLITFFGNRNDADSQKIAWELGSCKDFRVIADYHAVVGPQYHPLSIMKEHTLVRVEETFAVMGI